MGADAAPVPSAQGCAAVVHGHVVRHRGKMGTCIWRGQSCFVEASLGNSPWQRSACPCSRCPALTRFPLETPIKWAFNPLWHLLCFR